MILMCVQATMLPSEFKAGKLQAYKLICEMMTKHQDVLPNSDFLVYLYHVMHKGFSSDDQVQLILHACFIKPACVLFLVLHFCLAHYQV